LCHPSIIKYQFPAEVSKSFFFSYKNYEKFICIKTVESEKCFSWEIAKYMENGKFAGGNDKLFDSENKGKTSTCCFSLYYIFIFSNRIIRKYIIIKKKLSFFTFICFFF
jgi:hypothetical protein